jgi:hypothetical protein
MTDLQVLTQTSRVGDFVHQSQTMASNEDFKNVSKLWFDKTISFDEGREQMSLLRKEREDINFKGSHVKFSCDDKGVIFSIDDRQFRPTEHALKKACYYYQIPTTLISYYLNPPSNGKFQRDESDFGLIVAALENGKRRLDPEKEMLFRTYKSGELRAVMSDKYSIVDNDWYIDVISKLIPEGRLSHWRGDADTIYGNILIPDSIREEDDSDYGGMISVSNCEIGVRILGQTPGIFRAICRNGCIHSQLMGIALKQKHMGVDLDDLTGQLKENIVKQIPLTTSGIDLLLVTKNWKIETQMVNILAAIRNQTGIGQKVMKSVAEEYLKQGSMGTAFGAVDAITRVGQLQDNETWVKLDNLAGKIIDQNVWNRYQSMAKTLTQKEVIKSLGL